MTTQPKHDRKLATTFSMCRPAGILWSVALSTLLSGSVHAQSNYTTPYTFTTLAGVAGQSANGAGRAARFYHPSGVAVDASGNSYVADTTNNLIRKITPKGLVTIFAGRVGIAGSSDGNYHVAEFNQPQNLAVDASGNVFVADTKNNTIRKITSSGVVSTFAGTAGLTGFTNGTAGQARFNNPTGVAIDSAGNLFIADEGNHAIRRITPTGVVRTLAGNGRSGYADGTGTAGRFSNPRDIAIDAAGNLYICDLGNYVIRKVTSTGTVSTLAGMPGVPGSADGTGSAARFGYPNGGGPDGIAVNLVTGNIYIADSINQTIRQITSAGVVTTLAGMVGKVGSSDGTGSAAKFYWPAGLAVDQDGTILVADLANNSIRKVTTAGVVTTFAGTAAGSDGKGRAADFDLIRYLALHGDTLFLEDQGSDVIRTVSQLGNVTTSAVNLIFVPYDNFSGCGVDSQGNIFIASPSFIQMVSATGNVKIFAGSSKIGSRDGVGTNAEFSGLGGVTVDAANNLFVADIGNSTIRKVAPDGTVTTVAGRAGSYGSQDGMGTAARFNYPGDVTVDSNGNLYVADTSNFTIRKITPDGTVSTLAGAAGQAGSADGVGSAARFNHPGALAVDASGNVFVSDTDNNTIRMITPTGVVSTVSGLATQAGSGNGTGATARFNQPYGIVVDSFDNLYVVDSGNETVRIGVPEVLPVITSNSRVSGAISTFLTYQVTGYNSPTGYSVKGTLPPGLSLNTTSGLISGTPTLAGIETVTITATNSAGSSSADVTFTINKIKQTVTFPALGTQPSDVPFAPGATASSGLPITYAIVSGPATVVGNKVNFTGAGRVLIEGTQSGNRDFAPATAQSNVIAVQVTQ